MALFSEQEAQFVTVGIIINANPPGVKFAYNQMVVYWYLSRKKELWVLWAGAACPQHPSPGLLIWYSDWSTWSFWM